MSDADRLKQITELQDLLAAANARADKAELEAVGWAEEANALRAEAHDRHIVQAKATDEVRALREHITELEDERDVWRFRASVRSDLAPIYLEERDRLQARIDKALALADELVVGEYSAVMAFVATRLRAALSDTAGPEPIRADLTYGDERGDQ